MPQRASAHSNPDAISGIGGAVEHLRAHLRSLGIETGRPAPEHVTSVAVAEAYESFQREIESLATVSAAAGWPVHWLELAGRCRGAALAIEAYAALPDPDAIRLTVDGLWQHAWSVGGPSKPPPALPEIKNASGALRAAAGLLAWTEESERQAAAEPAPQRRQKRGRPRDTNPKVDRRIHEAWCSGQYKTYDELARGLGKSEREVKRALDRHRKRMERRGE